jgi:hypothetical protein
LVEKILRGSNLEIKDKAVKEAYQLIGLLATSLYQGALMTKTAIDLSQIDRNNNIIATRNLFQGACQEAIAEINQAQPA